jgi:hypothetical protein
MNAKDILVIVIIPLALAEFGPWCGWFAAMLVPKAAKLRYGDTERAVIRAEEWSGHLNSIPGQLSKLGYATCQFLAGSVIVTERKVRNIVPRDPARRSLKVPARPTPVIDDDETGLMIFQTHQEILNSTQDTYMVLSRENFERDRAQGAAAQKIASSFLSVLAQ